MKQIQVALLLCTTVAIAAGCSSSGLTGPSDSEDSPAFSVVDLDNDATDGRDTFVTDEPSINGNWDLDTFALDDGTSQTPNEFTAVGLRFHSVNNFDATYICGGVAGQYSIDSNVLQTQNASLLEPVTTCLISPTSVATNSDLIDLVRSVFFNAQSIIIVEQDKLTITTGTNEALVYTRR